jgi:predicted permease
MPDWRGEIESRLSGARMDAASEHELIEELAQHLEDRYCEMIAAGADDSAAREAALEELWNLNARQWWAPSGAGREPVAMGTAASGRLSRDLLRDIRYGWRLMRKTPVLTSFAALSLALGIGANTTVFTIINTLLLHPIAAADPARLAMVYGTGAKDSRQAHIDLPLSYPNFEDYAKSQHCFREMAAFTPVQLMTLGDRSGQENVFAEFVTARYFDTLGVTPAVGRFFMPREDSTPGSAPVAVISYAAWKTRFGGSTDIMGRTLELNHNTFTVVGVAPRDFLGVSAVFGPDFWLPATMAEQGLFAGALFDRGKPLFRVFGRLAPGFTLQRAQAELEPLAAALERQYPGVNQGRRIAVRPVGDELFSAVGGGSSMEFGSGVLLAVVILILGIACSNVANLLLARAVIRRPEMAVRLAIGANRGRVIRQMLTESALLSLLSCSIGLAFGYAGCRFVWSFVPANVVRNMAAPRLDGGVLLFAVLVSLGTAVLFGLAPALRASKLDVAAALKEESPSSGRTRRAVNFSNLLLVSQVAFSMLCLITAALFFRSIQHAYAINPGFQTDRLAILLVDPRQAGYGQTRTQEFYREGRHRIAALPGVASVSWASGPPFWHNASRTIEIEGEEPRTQPDRIATVVFTVDTDYFDTMGIAVRSGRVFEETDREGAVPVAVVNQELAERYWPGGGALGHRFRFAGDATWRQVIGVVRTANYNTLGEPAQPCVYLPLRQNFAGGMYLYVRSEGDPGALLADLQRAIRAMDASLQVGDVRTGPMLIQQVLWGPMVGVALLGVFGSLALALASIGLYGVMAYSVNQRRREIGLRAALGAAPSSVVRLILREGMTLAGCGVGVGLIIGLMVGRVLSRMLFGISPADPISLGAAAAVLLAVAWIACYVPARSATRIDPLIALRHL